MLTVNCIGEGCIRKLLPGLCTLLLCSQCIMCHASRSFLLMVPSLFLSPDILFQCPVRVYMDRRTIKTDLTQRKGCDVSNLFDEAFYPIQPL